MNCAFSAAAVVAFFRSVPSLPLRLIVLVEVLEAIVCVRMAFQRSKLLKNKLVEALVEPQLVPSSAWTRDLYLYPSLKTSTLNP